MLPPELQPRGYRPPHISSSSSATDPTFSSSFNNGVYSPDRDPNPNPNPTNLILNSSPNSSFTSRSSRSLKDSRYSPSSSFIYNGRVDVALVPCAAFMLDLGGIPVVATLTLGLMCSYILYSLDFKPGAFFGVWFSLIAAQIAFFFSSELFTAFNSVLLGLLAAFLCAEVNFLIGALSSLQFRWIQALAVCLRSSCCLVSSGMACGLCCRNGKCFLLSHDFELCVLFALLHSSLVVFQVEARLGIPWRRNARRYAHIGTSRELSSHS